MQSNPTKVNFNYQTNTYANQYPLINQRQFGIGNNYPSYQMPPPYSPYPHPPIVRTPSVQPVVHYNSHTVLYSQANVVIVPAYRPFWINQLLTTITPNLRIYFIISGIIYLIWSLASISIEIYLIIHSYSTYYRGIWAGAFLLSGGICMLVVACRTSYAMTHMIKIFVLVLFFCVLGLILSIINYSSSKKCSFIFSSKSKCDTEIIRILKITIMAVFIIATSHTIMNIVIVTNKHKETMLKAAAPNASNH